MNFINPYFILIYEKVKFLWNYSANMIAKTRLVLKGLHFSSIRSFLVSQNMFKGNYECQKRIDAV